MVEIFYDLGIISCFTRFLSYSIRPSSEIIPRFINRQTLKGNIRFNLNELKVSIDNPALLSYGEIVAPLFVAIETMGACNLRCNHCIAWDSRYSKQIPTNRLLSLIDEMRDIGVLSITLTGGEPTLREDLIDIISYAADCQFHIQLATNGVLITEEYAQRLKQSGVHDVTISLDSNRSELHDRFRGLKGSFEKTLQGIRHCVQAGLRTTITCVISDRIEMNPQRMVDLAKTLSTNRVRFARVINDGNASCNGIVAHESLRKMQEFIEEISANYEVTGSFDFKKYRGILRYNGNYSKYGCGIGYLRCRINCDGAILPCEWFPRRALKWRGRNLLPNNIMENSFYRLWLNSPYLRSVRESIKQVTGYCGDCVYRNKWCHGGCRVEALLRTGDLCAPDPICAYRG